MFKNRRKSKDLMESLFQINKYVGVVDLEDRVLSLSIYTMEYLVLNKIAYLIYSLLNSGHTPNQIVSIIKEDNQNVPLSEIHEDVRNCCIDFLNRKMFIIN